MGKLKTGIFVFVGLILLLGLIYFLVEILKPKVAGIYVDSNPASAVYIDGVEAGRTPLEKTQEPGEVIVKLIPDSFEIPLSPYETKINLVAGAQTVIKRDFDGDEDKSSGEIISFEKIEKNQVSLAVVSVPDSAELIIDGSQRAFTPHRTTSLLPGVHELTLKAQGYQDKTFEVRTYEGYKLTAIVQLAKAEISLEEPEEDTGEEEKEEGGEKDYGQVKILSTPTGFLRVRNEPSTLGEEIGTVEPENTYDLLEIDVKTGWYKIKFVIEESGEEKEGWISDQYAEVTEPLPLTLTLTPKPSPEP